MADSDFKDKKQPDYGLETESDDPDSLNAITALVAEGEHLTPELTRASLHSRELTSSCW
jgi:hypothetical protein